MRLFIAAELGGEAKNEILKAEEAIRAQGVYGTFTKAENVHLTLAFIGEFNNPGKVLAAMRSVPFDGFGARLSGLGNFGNLWWCGLDCPRAFYGYVGRLRAALENAGIPCDRKKFKPHVTVLRRADCEFEVPAVRGVSTEISRVVLMKSEFSANGMIYTAIGDVKADRANGDA